MKFLLGFAFLSILSQMCYSQTAEEYYYLAAEAFNKADYQAALSHADKAFQLGAKSPNQFFIKGQCHYALGQYQYAYDTYSAALANYPEDAFLYNNRGNLLMSFQESDLAIQDYNAAIILAKNDSLKFTAYMNRGMAKYQKMDYNGAYEDLMVSYAFDSTDTGVLINLGAVCDEVGRGDETFKYLHKALEIDSMDVATIGNIGFKYQRNGDHKKAIEYFDRILQIDPKQALGYSNRSYSKLQLGDTESALSDINISIGLYPENSYAYRIRALIYLATSQTDKACDDLQIAIDKGFNQMYGDEVVTLQKKYCGK